MNFAEAEAYLYSLGNEVETMKFGLENITILLAALGDPQTKYRKVQVAGTNGKGSVCAFLDSILGEAGVRRGLYTSPHLVSITERIRIDGVDISEEEFARLATRVRQTSESLVAEGKLEHVPTYFEQVTAMALLAFGEAEVELAILETGLGGRYDAVTAAKAEIAAITRIDLDHQEYLGDTIEEIAAEKAAIIRKDSIVCVGKQDLVAMEVIRDRCRELGVQPTTLEYSRWERQSPGVNFVMNGFTAEEVVLQLEGDHQAENAALSILCAILLRSFFPISEMQVIWGLEKATHQGRLEWVESDGVQILLDGAHNVSGAKALRDHLESKRSGASIALVYGSMKDKDSVAILNVLAPLATDVIITKPTNTRSSEPKSMADPVRSQIGSEKVFVVDDVRDAFDTAFQLARTYPATRLSLVLVTGSLYLVGEVKKLLNN